jgi:hypothetical protein
MWLMNDYGGGIDIEDDDADIVATINLSGLISEEDCYKNARIIVAAPDVLIFSERLLEALDEKNSDFKFWDKYQDLKNSIKRAKGEI